MYYQYAQFIKGYTDFSYNKSRKKNNLLNIELNKIIEIMKLYPQKRVSAIGLISMTESQDVYLSFFLL